MSIHFVMKQTMLFGTLNQHIPLNRWKDWKVVVYSSSEDNSPSNVHSFPFVHVFGLQAIVTLLAYKAIVCLHE